jgi:arginase family enzyme
VGDPVGLEARELAAGVAVVSGALLAAADVCGAAPAAGPAGPQAAIAARVAAEIVAGVARRLS